MSNIELHLTIDQVKGFRVAGVNAGLKPDGKLDLALIVSDLPCVTAGIFTTNEVKAAPVLLDIARLKQNDERIHAVVINTGSANASTGNRGMEQALAVTQKAAEQIGRDETAVLTLSTGVIGRLLPMDLMENGIRLAAEQLNAAGWQSAARAIMTTDTQPKLASIQVTRSDGRQYTIAGIAKGSGMIAPHMATMLSVIVTDVGMTPEQAKDALRSAADVTFNRIVVDGDMSPNDTVLLLANAASGVNCQNEEDLNQFKMALILLCRKLAHMIVRDGEGATKFITVNVYGAPDNEAAHRIAYTIATSPLVKTAMYGNDANWGRILAAAGRAGVQLDMDALSLYIAAGVDAHDGELQLMDGAELSDYIEEAAEEIISNSEITLILECNIGNGFATIWTCDLSHDYISINADYRT